MHLHRFIRAYVLHLVTTDELVMVLGGLDVFTVATVIRAAGAR